MGIAGHVAVLVVAAVLAGPPHRSALMGEASQHIEEELRDGAALKGGVGGVPVETYRHADADAPHGDGDGEGDGPEDGALEGGRKDQQRCEVARDGDGSESVLHPVNELGHEDLHNEQDREDMDGGGTVAVRPGFGEEAERLGSLGERRPGRDGEEDGDAHHVDAHPGLVHVHPTAAVPRPRLRGGGGPPGVGGGLIGRGGVGVCGVGMNCAGFSNATSGDRFGCEDLSLLQLAALAHNTRRYRLRIGWYLGPKVSSASRKGRSDRPWLAENGWPRGLNFGICGPAYLSGPVTHHGAFRMVS